MQNVNQIVSDIELKINRIINRLDANEAENRKLSLDLSEKLQTIEMLQARIHLLEEENKILKIARTITTGTDTSDTKKQIDQLVREIDTCISLLNG